MTTTRTFNLRLEQRLIRISCELHEAARAAGMLRDDMVADELHQLERAVKAFTVNPALRARQDGERTPEEWLQYNQVLIEIIKYHQRAAEGIIGALEAAEENE